MSSVPASPESAHEHEGDAAEPRLLVTDADVPREPWNQLVAEVEALRIPAFNFGESRVGTDGVRYGVEFKNFSRTLRFDWWYKPPKGWEEFADWVTKAIDLFETSLAASDTGEER
ncbi:hypothetical protein [Myxococcus stipitatus]|uniref:hypothetical protein n=1 Tax=Myxococcus stipitatus TaxID=83455 RepID=UPI0030D1414E